MLCNSQPDATAGTYNDSNFQGHCVLYVGLKLSSDSQELPVREVNSVSAQPITKLMTSVSDLDTACTTCFTKNMNPATENACSYACHMAALEIRRGQLAMASMRMIQETGGPILQQLSVHIPPIVWSYKLLRDGVRLSRNVTPTTNAGECVHV